MAGKAIAVRRACCAFAVSSTIAAAFMQPAVAQQLPTVVRQGAMVTTGGTLDFSEPRTRAPRARRATRTKQATAAAPQGDWLYAFVDYLLDDGRASPPAHRRVRPGRRPSAAAAAHAPQAPRAVAAAGDGGASTIGSAGKPVGTAESKPVVATPTTVAPPIVTGAIDRDVAPGTLPTINKDDLDAAIIGDAELSQARNDLIKLELARRTYDETRLSGQSAFDQRFDWRVLERGRDAWNESELSAAVAAGFEANTYINDATKTIVIAIAGTQDLKRDFIEADIWRALIQAQAPQHFFLAKSYIRSVQARYQAAGYHTECVGHSLGGGACAYAASELGIRAIVVNPISAGKLGDLARNFVTNYVVDGDIAAAIYSLRGNELSGDVKKISVDREAIRRELQNRYGVLAGPIRVVRDISNSVKVHQIERALDIIAAHADTQRIK